MLINLDEHPQYQFDEQWIIGTLAALALGELLLFIYLAPAGTPSRGLLPALAGLKWTTQQIGLALYRHYMLPSKCFAVAAGGSCGCGSSWRRRGI